MEKENNPQKLAAAGKKLYAEGSYQQAADAFGAAAEGYARAENPLQAAEMANNRCVALLQIQQGEQALEAVRGTDRVFGEAGDVKRQAIALANLGTALKEVGEKEKALEHFQRSAELFSEIGEDELQVQVTQSASALQLKGRDPLGALASMRRGLGELEKPSLVQRWLKKLLDIPFKL